MSTRTKIKEHAEACGWRLTADVDPVVSFRRSTRNINVFFTFNGNVLEANVIDDGDENPRWVIRYRDKNKLSKVKAMLSEFR